MSLPSNMSVLDCLMLFHNSYTISSLNFALLLFFVSVWRVVFFTYLQIHWLIFQLYWIYWWAHPTNSSSWLLPGLFLVFPFDSFYIFHLSDDIPYLCSSWMVFTFSPRLFNILIIVLSKSLSDSSKIWVIFESGSVYCFVSQQ